MKMTPRALVLALVFAIAPQALPAAEAPGWNINAHALIGAQAPADVDKLMETIAITRVPAEALAKYAVDKKVRSAVMLRFRHAGDTTWFLYRTDDKAMVAKVSIDNGHVNAYDALAEVPPVQYDKLFDRLRHDRQGKPTPLTRNDKHWAHGYGAVVHVYEKGGSRSYLMPADEIRVVDNPNPIGDFFCGTLLSGMHCRPGPREHDGWIVKELNALMKSSLNRRSVINLLCEADNVYGACGSPNNW